MTDAYGSAGPDSTWIEGVLDPDMFRYALLFPLTPHECWIDAECPEQCMRGLEGCSACACTDCPVDFTPRMAHLIDIGLAVIADYAAADLAQHGDRPIREDTDELWRFFDQLPKLTWGMNGAWRQRFVESVRFLADDVAYGRWPKPRNNAEEIAMHLAIDYAKSLSEDGLEEVWPEHEQLPRAPGDYDFEVFMTVLLQDTDILFLYDDETEAFADPAHPTNRAMAIGDLRPVSWFDYFANVEPRPPAS
ncbi:hypothetical protein [Glycomyces sp. YM15]|uniref:hypothetical protein n=1 Tax=Glycomyces sp. YM15 TaxID=2800446 RepID=UPI001963BBCD|nr:hypothetical protein [Glycomyces sp. YM15]